MKTMPVISIGMPVYNAENTLAEAVTSIVQQTFEDWELLIIDDGSTDKTLEIAQGFNDQRIRVVSDNQNKRLAARLNQCVQLSKGDYFARMDGDDIAFPERLAEQLEYMKQHPEVDLVGGSALVFDSNHHVRGKRVTPEKHSEICRQPWRGFPMIHPTFMGKLSWFQIHPYDETLLKAQDQVLLASACQDSVYGNVQHIVLAYREDIPAIKKLLSSRMYLFSGLFSTYMKQQKLGWVFRAFLSHSLRLVMDLVFYVTQLRNFQLRLRSTSLSKDDIAEWNKIKKGISMPSDSEGKQVSG